MCELIKPKQNIVSSSPSSPSSTNIRMYPHASFRPFGCCKFCNSKRFTTTFHCYSASIPMHGTWPFWDCKPSTSKSCDRFESTYELTTKQKMMLNINTNVVETWIRQNIEHFNASCRLETRLAHIVICESFYFRMTNIVIMCGRLRCTILRQWSIGLSTGHVARIFEPISSTEDMCDAHTKVAAIMLHSWNNTQTEKESAIENHRINFPEKERKARWFCRAFFPPLEISVCTS